MFDPNRSYNYAETLGPAMEIKDQAEADKYFEALVVFKMQRCGTTRTDAERRVREDLGYYAGYYSASTQERVALLYGAKHPVFEATNGR